jgi:hypothetical protein
MQITWTAFQADAAGRATGPAITGWAGHDAARLARAYCEKYAGLVIVRSVL